MSDMSFYEDENDGGFYPDEDSIINMFLRQNGSQLPGEKPSQRLNFLQDMEQTLGLPMVQLLGMQPQGGEAPKPSLTRQMYGTNPLYAGVFDTIDQGADPISAIASIQGQVDPLEWEDPVFREQITNIATDYAKEKATSVADQASYTRADGSKYKNTPVGGTDIYGMASEYDLLGMPDEDKLIAEFVKSKQDARALKKPGLKPGQGQRARPEGEGRWSSGTALQIPRAGQAAVPGPSGQLINHGWGGAPPTSRAYNQALNGQRDAVPESTTVGDRVGGVSPMVPQVDDEYDKVLKNIAGYRVGKRVDQAKNTRVRSDANRNAMLRILGLRAATG